MRAPCFSVIFLLCATVGYSEPPNAKPALPPDLVAEPRTIPLWENGAPGALGNEDRDQPTITLYAPVDASETRSEEHTSELQSLAYLVCRLLLEKKKT